MLYSEEVQRPTIGRMQQPSFNILEIKAQADIVAVISDQMSLFFFGPTRRALLPNG